jgi:hypothetical protein
MYAYSSSFYDMWRDVKWRNVLKEDATMTQTAK